MAERKAYLVCNDKRANLTFDETSIGRLTTNSISINDPTVSKNHALINWLQGQNKFYLSDLNTVNGTYWNGNKLENNKKYVVTHKDAIQFGKRMLFCIQM